LVEAGRLGQKTKKGWYDYSAGRNPVDDEEVAAMIQRYSAEKGIKRRAISEEEVSEPLKGVV
jgi:3-hydroxyacyl-CoA dehydrogenase